jgi:predicted ATP-binding protein involved in virulence
VDIDWQLDPKVNILVGKNGVGKTTLLNIIESVINKEPSDYDFEIGALTINLNNSKYIQINKMYQPSLFEHLPEKYLEEILNNVPQLTNSIVKNFELADQEDGLGYKVLSEE